MLPGVKCRSRLPAAEAYTSQGARSARRAYGTPEFASHNLALRPARAITGEIRYVGEEGK